MPVHPLYYGRCYCVWVVPRRVSCKCRIVQTRDRRRGWTDSYTGRRKGVVGVDSLLQRGVFRDVSRLGLARLARICAAAYRVLWPALCATLRPEKTKGTRGATPFPESDTSPALGCLPPRTKRIRTTSGEEGQRLLSGEECSSRWQASA